MAISVAATLPDSINAQRQSQSIDRADAVRAGRLIDPIGSPGPARDGRSTRGEPMTYVLKAAQGGARSTAAVLWLMILLVFLPIATMHVLARLSEPATVEAAAR